MYCIVGLQASLLLLILSFHTLNNEFFVKDFCKNVQARVVIFDMQVDNDVLYRGLGNQSSAHSSLYLSYFLPFHILKNEFFVKDCCKSKQTRVIIFG